VVYPDTVAPNSFQRFALLVEKQISTTQVRLLIPEELQVFSLGGKGRMAQPGRAAGKEPKLAFAGHKTPFLAP
jgi:hypothetical protein